MTFIFQDIGELRHEYWLACHYMEADRINARRRQNANPEPEQKTASELIWEIFEKRNITLE